MIPIYERGKLSKQFIAFIKEEGVPDSSLPYWDDNSSYRFDWNIIGGESFRLIFDPHGYAFDVFYVKQKNPINAFFPEEYEYGKYSIDQKYAVERIVNRLSTKVFEPEKMIRSWVTTDLVQIRITLSMLNKIQIPKDVACAIFDNIVFTYWVRKRAYDAFLCKEIIQFPFAPDFTPF